jgi:hypothetical protein
MTVISVICHLRSANTSEWRNEKYSSKDKIPLQTDKGENRNPASQVNQGHSRSCHISLEALKETKSHLKCDLLDTLLTVHCFSVIHKNISFHQNNVLFSIFSSSLD